jgi:hypothetical protein
MAQEPICTSLPVLLVAFRVLRGHRGGGLPERHSCQRIRSRRVCFWKLVEELLKSGSSWPAACSEKRVCGLMAISRTPSRYPGGSAETGGYASSGASSWTAAAHEAGTHRTPWCLHRSCRFFSPRPAQAAPSCRPCVRRGYKGLESLYHRRRGARTQTTNIPPGPPFFIR